MMANDGQAIYLSFHKDTIRDVKKSKVARRFVANKGAGMGWQYLVLIGVLVQAIYALYALIQLAYLKLSTGKYIVFNLVIVLVPLVGASIFLLVYKSRIKQRKQAFFDVSQFARVSPQEMDKQDAQEKESQEQGVIIASPCEMGQGESVFGAEDKKDGDKKETVTKEQEGSLGTQETASNEYMI